MQAGMGLSKVVILLGAGYTGSIVLGNGKLSDILGDLQMLLKEKSKDSSPGDSQSANLSSQLDRLAREVQRMASSRPITVLNGNSDQGNITSLIMPVASLGLLGYGYMWWKGISFSDLMYVTKRNMANAVSSMTKHLEQVSAALAATKRHLTQRIENLDGKLDEQREISTDIRNEVTDVRFKVVNIGYDLNKVQELIGGLNGKMTMIEDKQDFQCAGVMYLCQFANEKGGKIPEFLQNITKSTTGKRGFLGFSETSALKGLQHITEAIKSENFDRSQTNAILQNDFDSMDNPKCLSRTTSIKW